MNKKREKFLKSWWSKRHPDLARWNSEFWKANEVARRQVQPAQQFSGMLPGKATTQQSRQEMIEAQHKATTNLSRIGGGLRD